MVTDYLASTINVPLDEVERLLTLPQSLIYHDPEFRALITTINVETLEATVAQARRAYESEIETFTQQMQERYGLPPNLTAYTLADWMISFLRSPEHLSEMTLFNVMVPRYIVAEVLPEILKMLDRIRSRRVRSEWQRATATLLIPLTSVHH